MPERDSTLDEKIAAVRRVVEQTTGVALCMRRDFPDSSATIGAEKHAAELAAVLADLEASRPTPGPDAERLVEIRRHVKAVAAMAGMEAERVQGHVTFLLRMLDAATRRAEALEAELRPYLAAKEQWEEFERVGAPWRPVAATHAADHEKDEKIKALEADVKRLEGLLKRGIVEPEIVPRPAFLDAPLAGGHTERARKRCLVRSKRVVDLELCHYPTCLTDTRKMFDACRDYAAADRAGAEKMRERAKAQCTAIAAGYLNENRSDKEQGADMASVASHCASAIGALPLWNEE